MGTLKHINRSNKELLVKTQPRRTKHDCMELLQMARMFKKRGRKDKSDQLYRELVQVLRPDNAVSELQI